MLARTKKLTSALTCVLTVGGLLAAAASARSQTFQQSTVQQNLQVKVLTTGTGLIVLSPLIRVGDLSNPTKYCAAEQLTYAQATHTYTCANVPMGAQVTIRVANRPSGAYPAACTLNMFSTANPPHITFTYTFKADMIWGTNLTGVTCTSQGSTRSAQQS